jgi:hypothetical protein
VRRARFGPSEDDFLTEDELSSAKASLNHFEEMFVQRMFWKKHNETTKKKLKMLRIHLEEAAKRSRG